MTSVRLIMGIATLIVILAGVACETPPPQAEPVAEAPKPTPAQASANAGVARPVQAPKPEVANDTMVLVENGDSNMTSVLQPMEDSPPSVRKPPSREATATMTESKPAAGKPKIPDAMVTKPGEARPTSQAPKTIQWVADWKTATRQAKQSGKLIMADFYTDWCGWCKRLDKDTFPDARVVNMSSQFISIKLNAQKEGKGLARRNGVSGYPTILFFDPDGKVIGGISGYVKPDKFAAEMKKILKLEAKAAAKS